MSAARNSTVFFFNDTATTEIYTLSLHDALPIFAIKVGEHPLVRIERVALCELEAVMNVAKLRTEGGRAGHGGIQDRKSTRLNSSHLVISYAVFCLKKKKQRNRTKSR